MKDARDSDYRDRIIEEAADWFSRLQDPEVSAADRVNFTDWLSASPEHVREYLALTSLHTDLSELPATRTVEDLVRLAAASSSENVVSGHFDFFRAPVDRSTRETPEVPKKKPAVLRPWIAVAASLVLVMLVYVWWLRPDANRAVYATATGEQKSFPLPDGSLVTLNAVSKIQVSFTEHYRDIQLLSGEALFNVAKYPQRPFRVLTTDSVIQAVGTRFNVYHRHTDTTVTVVEGTVEIRRSALQTRAGETSQGLQPPSPSDAEGTEVRKSSTAIRITKGQRARIASQDAPITVSAADIAVDTAWRDRRLVFESRRLGDVVAEFNLYNESPIELSDPTLADIHVSGSFYANDPQSFALFLKEAKLAKSDVTRERIRLLPFDSL